MTSRIEVLARGRLAAAAERVVRWARDETWFFDLRITQFRRVGPVRFRSQDELAHLIDALRREPGGIAEVRLHGVGPLPEQSTSAYSPDQMAASFAKRSRADRRWLTISAYRPDGEQAFHATFSVEPGTMFVWITSPMSDEATRREVARLIDRHTVPYTREERRDLRPLVEQTTERDDLQEQREAKIARDAAKIGRTWGGWAGAAAGAILGAGAAALLQVILGP